MPTPAASPKCARCGHLKYYVGKNGKRNGKRHGRPQLLIAVEIGGLETRVYCPAFVAPAPGGGDE
jgi:hypothetical protein